MTGTPSPQQLKGYHVSRGQKVRENQGRGGERVLCRGGLGESRTCEGAGIALRAICPLPFNEKIV